MAARAAVVALISAVVIGAAAAGPPRDRTRPSAPLIIGPRQTVSATPTYFFSSRDPDNSPRTLRYRCAFDSIALHRCPGRYSERLERGEHRLRAQAVDPAGNRSRVSGATVTIAARPSG